MIVPKLRFPEFTGEWQVKKLGDIAELTSSKRVYLSDYVPSGIPFYRGKEITKLKENIKPDDVLYISDEAYNNFKHKFGAPKNNEILITAVGTLGNILRIRNDEPFYFKDGNLIWLKNINESSYFLEILLDYNKRKLLQSAIGSSQQALTIVGLNKVKLALPSKREQEKIAEFLTAVDERIAAGEKKLELLKKYKKDIMQKIFTQQIRFKDESGNLYHDWEERMLGDVYTFIRTNSISREALWSGEGVKNIHYGDIHKKLPVQLDVSNYNLPSIKQRNLIFPEQDYCQAGDVVLADASEDYTDIGKCIEIIHAGEREAVAGLHTMLLRPNDDVVVLGFGGHLFRSKDVRRQVSRIATGVSVLGISKANLAKILLRLPMLDEQKRIADFLTVLDDKIELEKTKLEQAKKFKKSLLQRMFV